MSNGIYAYLEPMDHYMTTLLRLVFTTTVGFLDHVDFYHPLSNLHLFGVHTFIYYSHYDTVSIMKGQNNYYTVVQLIKL